MAFDKNTNEFLGINTFGIRMRHDIFDQMLSKKRSVFHVVEHLSDCNFDPEFFKSYETEIISNFNAAQHTDIKPKKKSWSRIFNNLITK